LAYRANLLPLTEAVKICKMRAWLTLPILLLSAQSILAATCANLASLRLPNTTVTLAQTIEAGAFAPDAGTARRPSIFKTLAAFCRVAATLRPSPDSEIKMKVWLPAENWNGNLQAVGNGGWAGAINYSAMARALAHGYATASTDTGHATQGASFALDHPEKLVDFGYRAVHEMTVEAKEVVAAFYSRKAVRSYWNGCSTGGRQGLMEAQRFPADFDGIVAGAPANYLSHLQPWTLWVSKVLHESKESYIPPAKYAAVHQMVMKACDELDGVQDGVIEDPTKCHFNLQALACATADTPACLTPAQIETARKLYGPAKNSMGTKIFPGFSPGSEMGWNLLGGAQPISDPIESYKYVVFKNPSWNWMTLNLDDDVTALEKAFEPAVDATRTDLRAFTGRGGKLILYHGWNDPLIAPGNTLDYYNSVVYTMGIAQTENSIRLFMVPGMTHCGGGDGTPNFDMTAELENWLAHGRAPERVLASRANPDRTRPLCAYPLVAVYKGKGNTDSAENFVCGQLP
jgi:feruloyl esterase